MKILYKIFFISLLVSVSVFYIAALIGLYNQLSKGTLSASAFSAFLNLQLGNLFYGFGYSLLLCVPFFLLVFSSKLVIENKNKSLPKILSFLTSDSFISSVFITSWLGFSLDEISFSFIISVISFLALLRPVFSDFEE